LTCSVLEDIRTQLTFLLSVTECSKDPMFFLEGSVTSCFILWIYLPFNKPLTWLSVMCKGEARLNLEASTTICISTLNLCLSTLVVVRIFAPWLSVCPAMRGYVLSFLFVNWNDMPAVVTSVNEL
jgi:hypothetical protein